MGGGWFVVLKMLETPSNWVQVNTTNEALHGFSAKLTNLWETRRDDFSVTFAVDFRTGSSSESYPGVLSTLNEAVRPATTAEVVETYESP